MIWTGATVFIFLILHFFNFYFVKLGLVKGNPEDFYSMAHSLFKIPQYNYIYLTCFAVLGFHLYHAFSSAFQTLGLNHRIWTPVSKGCCSYLFNCDSVIFCIYFNHFMAFQVVLEK